MNRKNTIIQLNDELKYIKLYIVIARFDLLLARLGFATARFDIL